MPKGPERTRVVSELRELYEGGISIRGIASVTDWSYSTVHRLLTEAGTVFRPVGGEALAARSLLREGAGEYGAPGEAGSSGTG